MHIRFTRRDDGADILTCIRDDGTVTWGRNPVGVPHDLLHYAVETTLGYTEAFWGMIAAGRDLDAFGTRDGVKDTYPLEALCAEHLVGLLQWPFAGGAIPADGEVAEGIAALCATLGAAVADVTASDVSAIRTAAQALMEQWGILPVGGTLDLIFPPTA